MDVFPAAFHIRVGHPDGVGMKNSLFRENNRKAA